jgi:HrpA-like RNA helicase
MLNLFSPEASHIVVAQPRRLACQTAARRVAQEQGYTLGKSRSCPIGYAVRFESVQPSYDCDRTIQFQTPGVLLRRAAEDPLLSDVTHLCIDEIHERNADIDLLLALAKQAVRRRLKHKDLPPLKVILMSATLDSSHWESYFRENNDRGDDNAPTVSVAVVNVPEIRRYPITTVHLDDERFPLERYYTQELIHKRGQYDEDSDDDICRVTALLALRLYEKSMEGSILCFLPGMEEIRRVHRYIDYRHKGQILPKVIYLHSSVSSTDQALAFEPGAKIILSTNIAETSVTIPDCKYVIDSGRERQFSLLGSSSSTAETSNESETTNSISVVGSQLMSVDISQASAKQRAGRAGRVSAGTCYRLYTKNMFDFELPEFTTPEMLRMDLSQLVLHSISLYHPSSGDHPLSLLSGAPDPPEESKLRQTLRGLVSQGLVDIDDDKKALNSFTSINKGATTGNEDPNDHPIRLTPLGRAVNEFPVEPRVGRMLFLGLVLRAIDPALTIAALLSVPKVFSPSSSGKDETKGITTCSDIIVQMEAYSNYRNGFQRNNPKAVVFDQVTRIRSQLERAMSGYLSRSARGRQYNETEGPNEINWNLNSNRVATQAALICSATPHIAHLVHAKEGFSTRDVPGTAKIHPTSVNHRPARRAYWYVYHELRQAKAPYLYTTTAVSPLELALFADADSLLRMGPNDQSGILYEHIKNVFGDDSWMFHADHWVPVVASIPSQKDTILRLRQMFMYDMLQQVALDPISFATNEKYFEVVLYVLSALEQQRLPPQAERNIII